MLKNNRFAASTLLGICLALSAPTFAGSALMHKKTYVQHIGANEWGHVTVDADESREVKVRAWVESPQPHDIHLDSKQNSGATGFEATFSKHLLPGPVYVSKDVDGSFSHKRDEVAGACGMWLTFGPRKLTVDVTNDEACGFRPQLDFSGTYTPKKP